MKLIYFILFTASVFCTAQTQNSTHDFKFYINGSFKNSKKVNLMMASNTDTINCIIKNDKIRIPKTSETHNLIIKHKRKTYIINNVDFSKLDKNSKVIFGIENDLENFIPIKNLPNSYFMADYLLSIDIENYNQAKSVCFIIFNSKKTKHNKTTEFKNYSRSEIIKIK